MFNKKKFLKYSLISILYCISSYSNAAIVTIIKPLGFIAAAIADRVTSVDVIIPNYSTMHNYSLCPLDVIKIKNADFIVFIGSTSEPMYFKKIIHNLKKKILS
ncbi:MAG: zinc ABC transporter substrate-binding protein [Candidatus Phytoplasma australasiaticum]|nr:zinc ABC transporter substrate-binding protein [Candidatus Phytoplasma australasiaticum]